MATKPTPVTDAQLNRVDQATQQGSHVDEPMAVQADDIEDAANVDSITAIIQAIGRDMNTEKAKLAVALLNVTSYAVGLQGRSAWNTRDFMSFGVALAALSQIDGSDPSKAGGVNEYAPRTRGVDMAALERTMR